MSAAAPSRPTFIVIVADEAGGASAPVGFGLPVQLTTSMPRWMSSLAMKYVRVPSPLLTILKSSAAQVLALDRVNEDVSRYSTLPAAFTK
jgi:hypothetical protein